MNKKDVLIFSFALCLFAATPLISFAQTPFGGLVTAIIPCNSGELVYVLEPFFGVIPVMWNTGELPFLMHVPPHPGQEMLGMLGTAFEPCIIGAIPTGGGLPILYHGESL